MATYSHDGVKLKPVTCFFLCESTAVKKTKKTRHTLSYFVTNLILLICSMCCLFDCCVM